MNEIYRYLYRLTHNKQQAEDLTQETFCRALQFLDSYKGEKVRPWLFKVAYHSFIDWYRKNRRQQYVDPTTMEEIINHSMPGHELSPVNHLIEREAQKNIRMTLDLLPEKQKQVLILRYFHQFTYKEIADVMGISLTDVKSSLFRGRQKFKTVWKEE